MYPLSNIETRVNANGRSSSQEHIITASLQESEFNKDTFDPEAQVGGISKTVEFVFHESAAQKP
jgi:hypothetical protein